MSENRLIDIESKLAHQEQMLIELNDEVTRQQSRIMQLERLGTSLVDRLQSLADAAPGEDAQEERPPHY